MIAFKIDKVELIATTLPSCPASTGHLLLKSEAIALRLISPEL
jgi:hypothetical protein